MLEAPIRPEIRQLGPEPLDPQFTLARFKQLFAGRKGRIKQMLMNPKFIAGARPSCQLSQEQLSSALGPAHPALAHAQRLRMLRYLVVARRPVPALRAGMRSSSLPKRTGFASGRLSGRRGGLPDGGHSHQVQSIVKSVTGPDTASCFQGTCAPSPASGADTPRIRWCDNIPAGAVDREGF